MNGCNTFQLKLLIIITSVILFILGCTIMGMGIYFYLMPTPTPSIGKTAIIIGLFISNVTCYAIFSIKINRIEINVVICIIFLILSAGLLICSFDGLIKENEQFIKINRYIKNVYFELNRTEFRAKIKAIHNFYECCGYHGPTDSQVLTNDMAYVNLGKGPQQLTNVTYLIPECCADFYIACTILDAYDKGCLNIILKEHSTLTISIVSTMFATGLGHLLFVFLYIQQIKLILGRI